MKTRGNKCFKFRFLQSQKIRNFIIDHFPRQRTKIMIFSFDFCNRKNIAQLPGPYLQSSYWGQDYCPFTWATITAQLRVTGILPSYRSQDYSPVSGARITATYQNRDYCPAIGSRITVQFPEPGLQSSYQATIVLIVVQLPRGARFTVQLPEPRLLPSYLGQDYCPVTGARISAQLPGPGLQSSSWSQDYSPVTRTRITANSPGPGI